MVRGLKEEAKSELSALKVRPARSRGQNFLVDHAAIEEVFSFAEVNSKDSVVEVGPGLGALTEELYRSARQLFLVEIEPEFASQLKVRFPESKVIESDVRLIKLHTITNDKVVVVSNVPYSISTEFSMWLFRESRYISRASLLLQKEFAERLAASPGSKAYGSLTVHRARYASASLGPVISAEAFHPRPKVASRMVALDFDNPEISIGDLEEGRFEKFVQAAFSQKRKTLINSLTSSGMFEDKESARSFLGEMGIGEKARAEELEPRQFVDLALELSKKFHPYPEG